MSIRIAMAGAAGRMGQRIIALASADPDCQIAAALERAESMALQADAGVTAGVANLSVPITRDLIQTADVMIEFTAPSATLHWVHLCVDRRMPIVIGTTGHSDEQLARLREASGKIPILKAPNMSVGVNVLFRLAEMLGGALDPTYDVEIVEAHHRYKTDAPSGTALALRDAVRSARMAAGHGDSPVVHGRQGIHPNRPAGEIGMHALRIGDTVGEHSVAFGNLGETVTIAHSAHSRDPFAFGALRAAKWIVNRPPGLYSMQDVLFGPSREKGGA